MSKTGPTWAENSINMPFTKSLLRFTFTLTNLGEKTSVVPAQKPTAGFSSRRFQVILHSKPVIFIRLLFKFSFFLALGEPR